MYQITKNCEIRNCEFVKGEIVDKIVPYYPTVMQTTASAPTHSVKLVGEKFIKTEIQKQAPKKGGKWAKNTDATVAEIPTSDTNTAVPNTENQ